MSSEAVTARNRANAARSTGPRSVSGKSRAAQNARRHGATARPDPECVATWARIILDAADLAPSDLLTEDVRTRRATALAAAEVRLAETAHALDAFESYLALPSDQKEPMMVTAKIIETTRTWGPVGAGPGSGRAHVEKETVIIEVDDGQPGSQRHRLLKRYWREARAQRKRAFGDWVECLQELGSAPSLTGQETEIPKRSQTTT